MQQFLYFFVTLSDSIIRLAEVCSPRISFRLKFGNKIFTRLTIQLSHFGFSFQTQHLVQNIRIYLERNTCFEGI